MSDNKIPEDQKAAMDKVLSGFYSLEPHEIWLAMQGFYAATETNCSFAAYALKFDMPPLLSILGNIRGVQRFHEPLTNSDEVIPEYVQEFK